VGSGMDDIGGDATVLGGAVVIVPGNTDTKLL
jgi:hypothetical protein